MATTYLTLVNLVCKRLNEAVLDASTFAGAAGQHATIKDAVNASIREIQRVYPEWPWNKTNVNFNTVAGTSEYTPPVTIGNIDWDTFYVARNDGASPAITAQSLRSIEYTYYAQYMRPNDQQADSAQWAKPRFVVRSQENHILLSSYPDTVYSINYEGWTVPDDLSVHSDVSILPDRYNSVIVEGALVFMYQFRDNQGARATSQDIFKRGTDEMLRIEIPNPQALRSFVLPKRGWTWVASRTF